MTHLIAFDNLDKGEPQNQPIKMQSLPPHMF
jgi:hypothetical protein